MSLFTERLAYGLNESGVRAPLLLLLYIYINMKEMTLLCYN